MEFPEDLKYSKEHEWVRLEGNIAVIGITSHAQDELGDVVYVEAPEIGSTVDASGTFGVVESVKAVSDLYSPVSGTVVEVNSRLEEEPELVNSDPYNKAWIIKVEMSDSNELDALLNSEEYASYVRAEGK
ncbi:MAG: glycine cleavage system protein GcvH [Nitrospinota bacterium]|nr:glycine cleavage system protein GcvH [Nitrospinota bacterium]